DEYPGENSWALTEDGVLIASGDGATQSVTVCVDPTLCYVFTMLDSFGDGQFGSDFGGVDGTTSITLDGTEIFTSTGDWGDSISHEFGTCAITGCTDPAAINYDPLATEDDGSCIITTLNETPALATPLTLNVATGPGAGCNGLSGEDMGAAQLVASEGVYQQVNPDLWYSFTPFSSGNRIQVVTTDFDALIEVFDANMNLVTETSGLPFEDDNFFDGDEIYHVGNLTAGQQYYIRVAPYFPVTGPALFDICVQTLRDSRCDYGPGPYSLCQLFKADFVYSDQYIFNFTSQNTGITYTSNPQTSTFLQLSNVPDLQFGDDYDVAIDAVYNFQDGAGNAVQVICVNDEPCTMSLYTPNTISMRTQDNSVNHGPHFPGNYIRANSFVCSADRYSWRLTRTDVAELPIEYTTNTTSTWVRISDVLGAAAAAGGVYNVEVKPVFDSGQDIGYGTVQEITILGVAGIQGDVLTAAPQIEEAGSTKLDLNFADAMVYPNPSTGDNITINLNNIDASAEQGVIEVTDFVGRTVASFQITLSGSTHQEVINLSHLASGTYLMNINVNGTVMTEKIVIAQ
ncbi:MAG: T9SS type A sorting domain-containing protein, partial [Flavobacteriales bacterium]|nr:T9SS type A sorting domain-containing protein [Flavobacteriales bacterium]